MQKITVAGKIKKKIKKNHLVTVKVLVCPERLFTVSGRKPQYSQCKTIRKAGRPSRRILTSSVSHWLHLCQPQTQVETALLYSPILLFILCCCCSRLSVRFCANHTESTASQILSVCTHARLINLILILSHWFSLRPSQTQVETAVSTYCPDDNITHIYLPSKS